MTYSVSSGTLNPTQLNSGRILKHSDKMAVAYRDARYKPCRMFIAIRLSSATDMLLSRRHKVVEIKNNYHSCLSFSKFNMTQCSTLAYFGTMSLAIVCICISSMSMHVSCLSNYVLLLGGVALEVQRPIVVKLSRERSVGRSVRRSVCLSSALWKNDGSDPESVWRRRSDGSKDEAGSEVWGSVHGKGYFWGHIWGAPLCPMGTSRRTCATVPQPSELRFGVVRVVGRGIAVLNGGCTSCKGKGRFLGGFVLYFYNGKCHWVADGARYR